MSDKLYVRTDTGTGEPLVLLHGMFADGSQWHDIAKLLRADFRVIVVDLLGHGQSPRPRGATYSVDEHVTALRNTLVALGATKNAILVGYSMGGAIALAYGSIYPQSVEQLYLISTPYYLQPEEMIPARYASSLIITKATRGLFHTVEKLLERRKLAKQITDFGNKSNTFHAMIGSHDNTLDADIISKNIDTLVRNFDFVKHLKNLKVPLTFYVGNKDVFVVQGQLDALRQYQPAMDIQRLDIIKIDHMLVQNLPKEMARLLERNRRRPLHVGFDHGHGEPLLLLNGIESSTDYWQPLLPALLQGRRVIAIDLLGFGKSPKPLNIIYSLQDQVDWLANTIESLGLTQFSLMAHSLGALVALKYAAQNSKRVKSLILFSPVFVPKSGTANSKLLKRIQFVDKISAGSNVYSLTAQALGRKRMAEYLPLVRSVRNGIQHQDMAKTMQALTTTPMTILYGERDYLVDKDYLRYVTRSLQKATITELPHTGHNFPFFDPQTTIKYLPEYQADTKPVQKAGILPKTFLQQLAKLAAPILSAKSILYIGSGLLLFTDFAPWVITLGLCFYVFRLGYGYIRGAFSLKNENLSYIGYVLLGIAAILLSFFLYKQSQLALKISSLIVCGLILLSGLSKLLVGALWTEQKHLRRKLLLAGAFMALVGLSALAGSIVSIKLIVVIIAVAAIARGLQFGAYAFSAMLLAYVRGYEKD